MLNKQEFIETVVYMANRCSELGYDLTETKLYKLLWFANIEHSDRYGSLLIHDIFIKKQFGPVPKGGRDYIQDMRTSGSLSDGNIKIEVEVWGDGSGITYRIKPVRAHNPDLFTPSRTSVLDETIRKHAQKTASELSDLSHDVAWREAIENRTVDITKDLKSPAFREMISEQYKNTAFLLSV